MSGKATKRARRQLKSTVAALDARKRLARKVPWWRTVMLALGYGGFGKRWLERWERKHTDALKHAVKETAHYKMRQGAQPLPRHITTEVSR